MNEELKERLRQVMKRSIETCTVMGVSLLAEKEDEELLCCQEGLADREENRKMERDTIFRLYSQTKPVTGAAAMILMEQGCLDLCQPVSDFIPAFAHVKVAEQDGLTAPDRPVLVHDLLRMTSGILYPDEVTTSGKAVDRVFREAGRRLHTEEAMTTQEMAERLAECPLMYHPGSSWSYGASADVMGAVIEKISGMRFSEFMEKELFAPLGMKDTAFWVPAEKRNRLAAAYETVAREDGSREMLRYTGDHLAICNDMKKPPAFESGGAGLVSTLDDYMRFARMLRNGGSLDGRRILKPETVRYFTGGELMAKQQPVFEKWVGLDGFTYSNLMRICKTPARCGMAAKAGEYGWDGWLGMYFANFPEENMTILMGCQKKEGATFDLTRKLRNMLLVNL